MPEFEKWFRFAKERAEDDMLRLETTRKALRMLEVAVKAIQRASMMYFNDEKGIDGMLAETEDEINELAKEQE